MRLDRLIPITADNMFISALNVTGITADSRCVLPGYAFFALQGNKGDGGAYIQDAIARGAVVVLTDHHMNAEKNTKTDSLFLLDDPFSKDSFNVDNNNQKPQMLHPLEKIQSYSKNVPIIYVKNARHELAMAAARFYGKQPEVVVAVTGTSGKTSVASFTQQIWKESGFPAASIGTIGVVTPTHINYGSLTTPDPVLLQKTLADLAHEGVTHAILEASSHGLDQSRLDGIHLSAGAFTNLSRDHMDYHETVEEYFNAKMRLFDHVLPIDAPAIIYADDAHSQAAISHVQKAKRKVLTVGKNGDYIKVIRVETERCFQMIDLIFDEQLYDIKLPLGGYFQVANALVAAGLTLATGVPAAAVFRALERLKGAPGRLELVGETKDHASIYVDYAHKPEALQQVLQSVRPFTTGRVIVLFGCGGDRDKGKRPLMGAIAEKYSDFAIVTDDNPRTEEASLIRHEIMAAMKNGVEIGDRAVAISYAISQLKAGDTLLVAGKGHEKGQIIGHETLPFSDQQEIIAALERQNR
ncbi:UDP-N-acetylmuramoyl-L-alanyl-D-glutamate--2,6-diaminopimelate ligase [Bartonella tamiae]|uniref:UDP-N-acetylmuramoyl-L-alanyl-D-glutamate--2,6-diaminopimelate ligase n=1 Tax=Bartonella tamiae Th239 TaxID=1094558 RepID=J1JWV0_9HYPH|nr:UDP-N-acetylmuramoyl-L-alanyl-D-glutamate--2,6-diaminopimelate ligase [Bartonella tamiae]EJF89070.1 UDP-N-acetylmuramyl-tripeptide synthetase [Bartonella tamiae Th239]EJF94680.1 UDP-N-acetylmuramyl-tripeptide synthetase [Bartonella tamiae Th307]